MIFNADAAEGENVHRPDLGVLLGGLGGGLGLIQQGGQIGDGVGAGGVFAAGDDLIAVLILKDLSPVAIIGLGVAMVGSEVFDSPELLIGGVVHIDLLHDVILPGLSACPMLSWLLGMAQVYATMLALSSRQTQFQRNRQVCALIFGHYDDACIVCGTDACIVACDMV